MKINKPLKQKTPLKKKTSLKAKTSLKSNSKLKANSVLKQNQPLKKRSEKSQRLYAEKRVPLVKKLLSERPLCEACHLYAEIDGLMVFRVNQSCDLHEIKSRGRTGGIHSTEWLDEENILCVCRSCHRRITDNPDEAESLGLLK